ncbi:glutamate 5-kinase [Candidatus Nomurabacteria bacterium]|nr:glutamate 5-kinase [Candidatus Nomurabacteria bacterium]
MNEKDLYILKIGTNTLFNDKGIIRGKVIKEILSGAKKIMKEGKNIVVVTSGAVRIGKVFLKTKNVSKAVAASVGSPLLFDEYQKHAHKMGTVLAEFLVTRSSIQKRPQFLILQETFNDLFEKGIIPIVNENDALVSGTDWSFGDNDSLASTLAISFSAKKLIIVSHVEGLYDGDPSENKKAKIIKKVDSISDEFLGYCSKSVSTNGLGGMLSKLNVARICTAVGIETQVVGGLIQGNITKALMGNYPGTVFNARTINGKISNRDRWILAAKNSIGSIEIDDGAVKALNSGMSLLAVGVKKIYGQFKRDEVIEIVDKNSKGIAFGIIDLSSTEIESLMINKDTHKVQIIHANNMFILK